MEKPEPLSCHFCGHIPSVVRQREAAACQTHGCAIHRVAIDLERWNTRAPVQTRNLLMECPDCHHATHDHDIVEGTAYCRYCGHPVDAEDP